jgi:hypothetical protein
LRLLAQSSLDRARRPPRAERRLAEELAKMGSQPRVWTGFIEWGLVVGTCPKREDDADAFCADVVQ